MSEKDTRSVFSRLGFGLFFFMLISQVVSTVLSIVIPIFIPSFFEQSWANWIISYAPLYFIAFPAMCAIWKTVPNKPYAPMITPKKLSVAEIIMIVCPCFTIVIIFNLLSTVLTKLIGNLKGSDVANPLEQMLSGSGIWISAFILIIVAPIMEEIIFRGFLYKKLIPYGSKVYILFSAATFAMFHGNLNQMFYAFLLGIIFAYVMQVTQSIKYSIILHMIINAMGSGISNIISQSENEMALDIYGMFLIAVLIIGIVIIVKWLLNRKQNMANLKKEPGIEKIENPKSIFLNAGMICYTLIIVLLVVLTLMMTTASSATPV